MNSIDYLELENRHQIPAYSKWPITLVRGEGCYVWDSGGHCYLDFYGGHCVALIGHSHPGWVEAIATQAGRLGFYSNVVGSDVRAIYQQRLVRFSGNHLQRVFLCNSGTEANETALKLALKATGRTEIISMEGGFHGRTAGALSVTRLGGYREQFPSMVRETKSVAFGEIRELQRALDRDVAAVILEPVQSMSGIRCAQPSYYRELIRNCHENGSLVIFDEVQTGMGRLGAPLATHKFAAPADIVTMAKGIANGVPMGAVLATDGVALSIEKGELGCTFGGGPLAAAAALAVLDAIEQAGLVEHAASLESVARELLLTGPVEEIRGHGLLLGLKTALPAKEVSQSLFEQGILVGTSADPRVVRLMPPLVIERRHFEVLAEALESVPVAHR